MFYPPDYNINNIIIVNKTKLPNTHSSPKNVRFTFRVFVAESIHIMSYCLVAKEDTMTLYTEIITEMD